MKPYDKMTKAALIAEIKSLESGEMPADNAAQLKQVAEVSALLEGTRAILTYREFNDTAKAIFDSCKKLIGATAGYVAMLSKDGAENEVLFLDAGGRPCTVDRELPMPIRGLREIAYRTNKTVYENDFPGSQWAGLMPKNHVTLDNVLFAPLILDGKAAGLLGLANKSGGFTTNDAYLATAFGELAAIALQNSRTLESLEKSEERLRSVVETASDAVVSVNCSMDIIFWNRAAETIFGWSADEIFGKPLSLIIPERLRINHDKGVANVISTGKISIIGKTVECTGVRKDGREFPLELSVARWESKKGLFFTGIVRDITERKLAEETLKKAYDALEYRVEERTAELKKSYETQTIVNSLLNLSLKDIALEEILQLTLERILEIPWLAFESSGSIFVVEDAPDLLVMKAQKRLAAPLQKTCARLPFGKCLCGRAAMTQQIQFADCLDNRHEISHEDMNHHGHYCVPVTSGGRVFGVINIYLKTGHIRDQYEEAFLAAIANALAGIIIRRKVETAIQESEKRYKQLLDSVTDYVYTVSIENGQPAATAHTPACTAMTGYTPQEYDADPFLWYRMIHEDDRAIVIKRTKGLISEEHVTHPIEHRIIHKDGPVRWVRNTMVPRYDESGRLSAYDGLITDITEHKKLEEQLRQSQKMEGIGQLAGGIAHDFNNVLNAVVGYAGLLQMKIDKSDPLRHFADEIAAAGQRGAALTHQILAFSRKQVLDMKPVDLNEIIRSIKKMLQRLVREDIAIELNLYDKKLMVLADASQIDQVLINLAANASDAMPTVGRMDISTEFFRMDHAYCGMHSYGAPGEYALLTASDTGCGMDTETRAHIFEPFFTTKEVGKGTGLGLAVVHGIIKQHGGYIDVYSEIGKGTVFKIYLPLTGHTAESSEETAAENIRGGTETILIAEDDASLRKLSNTLLSNFGYTVIEAVDGEDAVRKYIDNCKTVKLAILDGIMPKKSGKEALEEIRRVCPDIKAIFMSGYAEDIFTSAGISDNSEAFIRKPVKPDELAIKVREMLDQH